MVLAMEQMILRKTLVWFLLCGAIGILVQLGCCAALNIHRNNSGSLLNLPIRTKLSNINKDAFRANPGSLMEADKGRVNYVKFKITNQHLPRHQHFYQHTQQDQSLDVYIWTGSYSLEVELGTPPVRQIWVLDTGNELTWTQCLPCNTCFTQPSAYFNPNASTSYSRVNCSSADCAGFGVPCGSTPYCHYVLRYADGAVSAGDLAREVLTIGGRVASRSFPIGCGHVNADVTFSDIDGVMGFGLGQLGFPRQANVPSFAYCLTSPFSTSGNGYMEIPAKPPSSSNTRSCTPFDRSFVRSLYVVRLANVSVNDQHYTASSQTIVDSGTVFTRLPSDVYVAVRDAFRNAMTSLVTVWGPGVTRTFDTCFIIQPNTTVTLPSLSFDFAGGSSFIPTSSSLLFPVNESFYCFAFAPIEATYSILGSFQQQSYKFTYQLQNSTLCIDNKPTCS